MSAVSDFGYLLDTEDDYVFAIELDAEGEWVPAEEGVAGVKAFRILPDASFERIPHETLSKWFKMALVVSREEVLRVATSKRPTSKAKL